MTKEELQRIIAIDEGFRIELTTSTGNMDKFQEAICAFANDMPGSGKKGYLLIGVYDDGKISGMKQHLVSLYVSQRPQRTCKKMQRPVKRLNCPKFVPSCPKFVPSCPKFNLQNLL